MTSHQASPDCTWIQVWRCGRWYWSRLLLGLDLLWLVLQLAATRVILQLAANRAASLRDRYNPW